MGKNVFNPALQIASLRKIESEGYIVNFQNKRDFKGNHTFSFNLTNQQIDGEDINVLFESFKIRIEYRKTIAPKIFVEEPLLSKKNHVYKDNSLCLYHWSSYKWGDDKSIAYDLIPWVYSWVYFNDQWIKTGNWYAEEYQH